MNMEPKKPKTTISVFKADVGGPGHIMPFPGMIDEVRRYLEANGQGIYKSFHVSSTGDDIAIIVGHQRGPNDKALHELCYKAFIAATNVAKGLNAYAAGQDLFDTAFCGNLAGMGPQIIEMEIDERKGETVVLFCMDKTRAGAFSGAFRRACGTVEFNTGLLHSVKMQQGFVFEVLDNYYNGPGERVIRLNSNSEMPALAALLVVEDRYVIKSITSAATGELCAMVSTFCLDRSSSTHVGKDDPVALFRVQGGFTALGDVLGVFALCFLVGGGMRGSHKVVLMPVEVGTCVSDGDGPAVVSAQVFCINEGVLTDPTDGFKQPTWDKVREKASRINSWLRSIEPDGVTLPLNEIEYHGIQDTLEALQPRFEIVNVPAAT